MQSSRTPVSLPPLEMITNIQNISDRCCKSLDTLHRGDSIWADTSEAEKQSAKFFKWVLEADPPKEEEEEEDAPCSQHSLYSQLQKAPEYGKAIYEHLVALEDNIKLLSE